MVVGDRGGDGTVKGRAKCVFLTASSTNSTRWGFLWCCARIMAPLEPPSWCPGLSIDGRMLGLVPDEVVVGERRSAHASGWARIGLEHLRAHRVLWLRHRDKVPGRVHGKGYGVLRTHGPKPRQCWHGVARRPSRCVCGKFVGASHVAWKEFPQLKVQRSALKFEAGYLAMSRYRLDGGIGRAWAGRACLRRLGGDALGKLFWRECL